MDKLSINSKWQDWELKRELGRGAHGTTWLAEKTGPDGKTQSCVVKEMLMAPKKEPIKEAMELGISVEDLDSYFDIFRINFQKELDSYLKADSPHLAGYEKVEFVSNEDVPGWTGYLSRGYYKTLKDHFEGAPTGEKEAITVGRDICAALLEYERKGLVHGGISVSNIMADDSGRFLLTDHGIAKCSITAGKRLFGADRSYDAPEVVENSTYSHASDIYSLGMALRTIANNGEFPDDDLWRMSVSGGFGDILDRATAKDPGDRYKTAGDFLMALNMADKAPETIITPETDDAFSDESEEKKSKKGLIAGIIAVAAVAAIGAGLFILKPWQPRPTPGQTVNQATQAAETEKAAPETLNNESGKEDTAGSQQNETDATKEVAADGIIDIDRDTESLQEEIKSGSDLSQRYKPAAEYTLDSQKVDPVELDSMDRLGTYLLLDEIYARHGKIFPDEEIQKYFEDQDWYVPVTPSSEEALEEFADMEITNLNIIVRYQIEHGYRVYTN